MRFAHPSIHYILHTHTSTCMRITYVLYIRTFAQYTASELYYIVFRKLKKKICVNIAINNNNNIINIACDIYKYMYATIYLHILICEKRKINNKLHSNIQKEKKTKIKVQFTMDGADFLVPATCNVGSIRNANSLKNRIGPK